MAELNPNIILQGDNSQIFNPVKAEAAQQQLSEGRFNLAMQPLKMQQQQQVIDSTQLEQGAKKLELIGQLANGVNDQKSWDNAITQGEGFGLDVSKYKGTPYNPQTVATIRAQALSQKDQISNYIKQQMLGIHYANTFGKGLPGATTVTPTPAIPNGTTPFINDYQDGNNKSVSGYVGDVLGRVQKGDDIYSAILNQESGGNPNAPTSVDGAVGQAQIIPATFARYAKPGEKIGNPNDNLVVGHRIIDDLRQKLGDDPAKIATAYFSGEGNVNKDNSPPVMANKPPSQNPDETIKAYQARLSAWKANPTNIADQSEAKASGAVGVKDAEALNSAALEGHKTLDAINTLREASKQFVSGATAQAKTTVARWAKSMGYNLSQEDEAALDQKQVFAKVANDLIGQAAKAEGGASRLQAAFNAIKGSQPNVGLEPGTLNILFDKLEKKARYPIDQQRKWAGLRNSNPNAKFTDFNTQYVAGLGQDDEQANSAQQSGGSHPLDKYMVK